MTRRDETDARPSPPGLPDLEEVRRAVEGLRELQREIARESKVELTDREVREAIEAGRL